MSKTKSEIKWSNNLDLKIHSQLRESNHAVNDIVKQNITKTQQDEQGDPKPNSLTVNIEFTFSTESKHGTFSESLPISIPSHKLFSMADSHLHKDHKSIAVQNVQDRHNHGFKQATHKLATQVNGPKHYEGTPSYHTDFHHSEQAFYAYITERSNLDYLASSLKARGLHDGTKITEIKIDMHSIRYMCGNCEIGGLGLMKPQYHFVEMLTKALSEQNLKVDGGLKRNIHVSAEKPHKTTPLKNLSDHLALDSKNVNSTILSSDALACRIPSAEETDIHSRTMFISSDTSQGLGSKYKTTLAQLEKQEYANMILKGKNLRSHSKLNRQFIDDNKALEDPYPQKDLNQIQNAFLELALLNDLTPVNQTATLIKDARDTIRKDIAIYQSKLDKIKTDLLTYKIDSKYVSELSLQTLKNFNFLIESNTLTIREICKQIKNDKHFVETISLFSTEELKAMSIIGYKFFMENYNKDPENFLNFIHDALKANLDLERNLEINFVLYSWNDSIERLEKLYEIGTPDKIQEMYDSFGYNILKLAYNSQTFEAFASDAVIGYLTNLDEDDDRLDFEDLLDAYRENENMFWDIIRDSTGKNLGYEKIQSAYRAKHSHNDSGIDEDDLDADYFDDIDDTASTISDTDIYDNLVAEDEEDFGYDYQEYDSDYESEMSGECDW